MKSYKLKTYCVGYKPGKDKARLLAVRKSTYDKQRHTSMLMMKEIFAGSKELAKNTYITELTSEILSEEVPEELRREITDNE